MSHRASIRHRAAIAGSSECGCFYCLTRFKPTEIGSWADGGETALCPRCGIDSVLGDACGVSIDDAFLAAMRRRYF